MYPKGGGREILTHDKLVIFIRLINGLIFEFEHHLRFTMNGDSVKKKIFLMPAPLIRTYMQHVQHQHTSMVHLLFSNINIAHHCRFGLVHVSWPKGLQKAHRNSHSWSPSSTEGRSPFKQLT